jgi:FlaA1/EpsC-like NDP-sugar epimerase
MEEMRIGLRADQAAKFISRFSGFFRLLLDLFSWSVAAWVAVFLRFDFEIPQNFRQNLLQFIPFIGAVQLAIGLVSGLYRRRWRYGSIDEVAALVITSSATTVVVAVFNNWVFEPRLLPMSAIWFAGVVGLVLMAGIRYAWRLLLERRSRPGINADRTIVFGAGDGGDQAIRAMLQAPHSPYLPVAILDDDPLKKRLSIKGVRVLGGSNNIAEVAKTVSATVLLVAMPSIDGEFLTRITKEAEKCGLIVKVLPAVDQLLSGEISVDDIRDLTEADLLGRHQIALDLSSIAQYLTGRRVLVTGAGGSIGSELCRQLSKFNPKELMMLDRDESALHEVQLSMTGSAMLDTPDVILCDIRDQIGLEKIFVARRPEVVFHAAALKHLPMLEQYPIEAFKTNVIGTLNVVRACNLVSVTRFVNISTDKAADPISILGYSKRIAEKITSTSTDDQTGVYVSVRFGNVLNSRGSVLTTFREQISRGGPVTVTHPDVTRYFMTIPEAVQLLIQAGALGSQAEVLVLDMGNPVRILDVAQRMIAQSQKKIEIKFSNLRVGEKIDEDRLGAGEDDRRPFHKLISHTNVPTMRIQDIEIDVDKFENQQLVDLFKELCK